MNEKQNITKLRPDPHLQFFFNIFQIQNNSIWFLKTTFNNRCMFKHMKGVQTLLQI